jgi:DNA repair protein RecN (Recombination protein N)
MLELLAGISAELESLEGHAATREGMEKAFLAARDAYAAIAKELGALRRSAGKSLEKAVARELAELGMPKAQFSVQWSPTVDEDGMGSASGLESAEFLLSANAGEPLKQLSKVASGGELSRITLALKTALAGPSGVATLVFDEVDSGISGRVAEMVGHKLAALGSRCQLLCVTHLPQIASLPGRHLRVSKRVAGQQTLTEAEALDQKGRELEIAGMLSGKDVSETALSHARELLAADRH